MNTMMDTFTRCPVEQSPTGGIGGNIHAELRSSIRNEKKECQAFSSDIKLHIQSEHSFVYPDGMVVCGEQELSPIDPNAITNPIIIFEVLSKSTADYDRGDTFYKYRQLASLREYVLIEQKKPLIEVFTRRDESDYWKINRISGLDTILELSSIGIKIPLVEIYYNVSFQNGN